MAVSIVARYETGEIDMRTQHAFTRCLLTLSTMSVAGLICLSGCGGQPTNNSADEMKRLKERAAELMRKAHARSPGFKLLAYDASQLASLEDQPQQWLADTAPQHNMLVAINVAEDEQVIDMVGQRFDALNYVWTESGGPRRAVIAWSRSRFQITETIELSAGLGEDDDAGQQPLISRFRDQFTAQVFFVANVKLGADQIDFFSEWASDKVAPIIVVNSGAGDLAANPMWTKLDLGELPATSDESTPANLQLCMAHVSQDEPVDAQWISAPETLFGRAMMCVVENLEP